MGHDHPRSVVRPRPSGCCGSSGGGPLPSMRRGIAAAGLIALTALSACGPPHISGTYLSRGPNQVSLVQLVETPDHRLTGRVEDFAAGADGAIRNDVLALDGAADGADLTVMLKPVAFVEAGVTASGKVDGDTLTWSARGGTVSLRRGDLAAYQQAVNAISTRAAGLREAKLERDRAAQAALDDVRLLTDLRAFQPKLDRLSAGLDAALPRLAAAQGKYTALSARADTLLKRAMQTTRPGDFQRGQFAYAIGQVVFVTGQLHFQVQSFATSVDAADQSAASQWTALSARCADATSAETADACRSLASGYAALSPKQAAVSNQLRELEAVYQTEFAKQQATEERANAAA